MNFALTNIGIFTIEIRSIKRLHVSGIVDKMVEHPNNHDQIAPKKPNVASNSVNKAPLKEAIPHKFLVLKARQIPKVDEASDQMIQKLRFLSFTRHHRRDDT